MADRPLTLMAVHAHPDDEATGTGGLLARSAAEGIRTVLVTCTDGSCGDGPGGVKPGEPGHDPAAVVAMRQDELEKSCAVLGVDHLELLGYADSGMMGWPNNDAEGAFWTTPVPDAAAKLAELIRRYQPDVVVTYDENGFYGHPDHIQAHRITMAAVADTGLPAKVDWEDPDDEDGGPLSEVGLPDEQITTWLDTRAYGGQKYDALAAHASQSENIFFLRMGRERFTELMGIETFVRVQDRTGAATPEDDLFAGLR
jgi:LmbE family N-acetylglucosaminyl deacetylase